MDPNDLRDCVEQEIMELIEPVAWERCEVVNKAEQELLKTVLEQWGGVEPRRSPDAPRHQARKHSAGPLLHDVSEMFSGTQAGQSE